VCFPVYCLLPCWIGPTNCQPKRLGIRNAEIRHEEKYFDRWLYHAVRRTLNETTWKTVPKPRLSVFWKPNRGNRVFGFWILRSVQFSSVFRKPISEIFIGFCTPYLEAGGQGSPCNHHSVPDLSWQHGGSMLSPVWNNKSSFSHLTLLVRQEKGHRVEPVKFCLNNSHVYFWGPA